MSEHTHMFTESALIARYKVLCDKRDTVYATTAPLEAELNELNAKEDYYKQLAKAKGAEIDYHLGGESWIALKKEIVLIAKILGRPNGPLATKEE